MKRGLLVSLSVLALGWLVGCGGGGSSSGGSTPPQANALNGQYAFAMAGFDANGNALGIAGSFKADGFGHITAGEVDVNDDASTAVVVNNSSVTGGYAFDANGDSTLGTITLSNAITGLAHPLAFGFSLQASGNFGEIMTLDSNGFVAAGTMQLQSSSALSLSGMAGSWVATIDGRNGSSPTSVLGSFTLASTGATTGNTFDRSIAGLGTAPSTGASAAVTFASAGPDSNGRGTFTLTLNDGLVTSTTQNFAYYAITKSRFVAVETDAGSPMTGDFSSQGTLSATTVVTTGGVFGMAGIDVVAADEISAVGQLVMTGTGPTGATVNWDSNDNGATVTGSSLPGQAVTFDPTTGRGTVAVTNGNTNGLADTLVFYLTAPGAGFVLDATAGTNNRAMAGPLMAQATGPYSASTDLATGVALVRTRASSVNDAVALVGLFGLTTDETTYELLADERDFTNNTGAPTLDSAFAGITVGAVSGTVGRGTFTLPNGSGGGSTFAFYVIGPNQFYFIDITPTDGASSTFFASPH